MACHLIVIKHWGPHGLKRTIFILHAVWTTHLVFPFHVGVIMEDSVDHQHGCLKPKHLTALVKVLDTETFIFQLACDNFSFWQMCVKFLPETQEWNWHLCYLMLKLTSLPELFCKSWWPVHTGPPQRPVCQTSTWSVPAEARLRTPEILY